MGKKKKKQKQEKLRGGLMEKFKQKRSLYCSGLVTLKTLTRFDNQAFFRESLKPIKHIRDFDGF